MTWVRLDDGMPLHPKLLKLSDGAFRLWVNGLAFANRAVTDGFIGAEFVPTLDHRHTWKPAQTRAFIGELVAVGLWAETPSGYEIHGYSEYQEEALKVSVEARKAGARERKRKQREREKLRNGPHGHGVTGRDIGRDIGRDMRVTEHEIDPVTDARVYPGVSHPPVPSRPVPSSLPSEEKVPSSPADPTPSSGPSVQDQIRALTARYPSELVAEAHEGIALTRRNGKVSDSVWLKVLRQLEPHPVEAVTTAMRTYAERYADGEKGEAYLLGIVRSEAKKRGNGAPTLGTGHSPVAPPETFAEGDDPLDVWGEDVCREAGVAWS